MHVARRFQPLLVALLIAPALNAYPLQLADGVVPEQTRNGAAVISSGDDQAVATRNKADSAHVASTDADIDGSKVKEPVHLIQSREEAASKNICPLGQDCRSEGQSCGFADGYCATGLQCISDAKCVKVPTKGEACGASHGGLMCATGLQCMGDVCEPLAQFGDSCDQGELINGVGLKCASCCECTGSTKTVHWNPAPSESLPWMAYICLNQDSFLNNPNA